MTQQSIQIVLQIVLIAIGIYLAFFKTYTQKKTGDLATLEIIEEIHKKTEIVKDKFRRESERLRLDIHETKPNEYSLLTEELKKQLDKLKKELDELNDRSGLEKFFSGLFGSDGGAGEVSNNPYLKHQLVEAKVSLLLLSLKYEKVKCATC